MTQPTAPSRSTLLATASSVVAGYNAWSLSSILAPRSPTCTHEILPHSLGLPPMNNDQYGTYFSSNLPLFRNFNVTVHQSMVDVEAKKVVVQASSTAETDIGPYANEYVLVIEMGQDGKQAEKMVEWVDSGYSVTFLGRLRKEIERKNREEGGGGDQKL